MASSIALRTGRLRCIDTESALSATNHSACASMPTSSNSVDNLTPVHSAQETRPCSACTLAWIGSLENSGALLPPHSTNDTRHHRVAMQRFERKGHRLLHAAVDQKLVLVRIN